MTLGQLERRAGVTDRDAFWAQFSHIRGSTARDGKLRDNRFEAGVAELRKMAEARRHDAIAEVNRKARTGELTGGR